MAAFCFGCGTPRVSQRRRPLPMKFVETGDKMTGSQLRDSRDWRDSPFGGPFCLFQDALEVFQG